MYSNLNPLIIISSLTVFTMTLRIKSDSISAKVKNEIVKVSNFTLGIYLIHPLFLGFLRYVGISANTSSPIIFIR
jgi:surface polysaccharide O-acyltransferase-like enzyme